MKIKIKKLIVILTLISIVSLYLGWEKLDTLINENLGQAHNEYMLWNSNEVIGVEKLSFINFEINSNSDQIKVKYKIKNTSLNVIRIDKPISVAFVKADANTIGDPGSIYWKSKEEIPVKKEIKVDEIYQKEIIINRAEIEFYESQYYINAYYNKKLVAQYKVIEGVRK